MTAPFRHKDDGKNLADYGREYLIHCPKCKSSAVIKSKKLSCTTCGLVKHQSEKRYWYGQYIAQAKTQTGHCFIKCPRCNAHAPETVGLTLTTKLAQSSKKIRCHKCNAENRHAIDWLPILEKGEPRDPVFGCELFLQQNFNEGTIFAYNQHHATEYLAYIEATHREWKLPELHGYHSSFFTKLPSWIKSAKNRDKVSKALRHMIEKNKSPEN